MGLTEDAINDFKEITGNLDDFGVSLTFTPKDGVAFDLVGFHTQHHLSIDPNDGTPVNSKKASVAFAEGNLPEGISIRKDGEVNMKGWLVDVKDSSGAVKNYKASQWFPDEKLGVIVIILQDYVED